MKVWGRYWKVLSTFFEIGVLGGGSDGKEARAKKEEAREGGEAERDG